MIWVLAAVGAGFFQNLRTICHKQLSRELSDQAAAFGRFLFAWPFAVAALLVWLTLFGAEPLALNSGFAAWTMAGGFLQASFTIALGKAFRLQNFAVAVTLTKTEVIQVSLVAAIVLGQALTLPQWGAIAVCFVGVAILGLHKSKLGWRGLIAGLKGPALLWGLLGGLLLGASSVAFAGAARSVDGPAISIALTLLVCGLTFQVLVFGLFLRVTEPGELTKLARSGPLGWSVGATGMIASALWFLGFALAPVAYVRAVGQIELLFALLTGWLLFRERISRIEVLGLAAVASGILALLILQ